jgi:hypothetical protein
MVTINKLCSPATPMENLCGACSRPLVQEQAARTQRKEKHKHPQEKIS